MRLTTILLIALQLTVSISLAAEKTATTVTEPAKKIGKPKPVPTAIMTQGDFARELATSLGWLEGFKDEPNDRDLLQILEGRRTFKFEAEKVYNAKTDDVSVRKSDIFGPFSGESWLGGISVASPIRMKISIPLAGDYQFSAAAKGDGQVWKIAGGEYKVNSGNSLALTKIAPLKLKPGELELEMLLPQEGGLDYLLFSAPDHVSIEPMDGWRFGDKLTNLTMAYVTAATLGLEEKLPVDESIKPFNVIVSEMSGLPDSASLSQLRYYGQFSGKSWVKTTKAAADIVIPFKLAHAGSYDIKLRTMGKTLTGEIDGNQIVIPATSALQWVNLGLYRLAQGDHKLMIRIPPFSGIDAVEVTPRKASAEAYMALSGVTGAPDAAVTYADMVTNIARIRERFTTRK